MSNKKSALIAVGGTGGHVFPGLNLALHLIDKNYDVNVVTDKRGFKYSIPFKNIKIFILPSSPPIMKNIFTIIYSSILIMFSTFRSLIYLISNRPSIIFGMGGYASFHICIAAKILNIKFVIYENNFIIGKANRYLLPLTNKILVSNKDLKGIPKKYEKKIIQVGNIIRKEILNFKKEKLDYTKMRILVLGGSQAAKVFAEVLPVIFKECNDKRISLKIYQHCLPIQNEELISFYKKSNIDFEIFNFSKNLIEYFSKVNLAITRSGSSMLAELTNVNIPFISVPLPSSADNHQLINANFYKKKNFAFLVEEKDLNDQLLPLIQDVYENNSKLEKIINNQSQYSDKNVYNNINKVLEKILNEKN